MIHIILNINTIQLKTRKTPVLSILTFTLPPFCTSHSYTLSFEVSDLLPTQKQVLISLITNDYAKKNEYYNELVSNNITLESLFND